LKAPAGAAGIRFLRNQPAQELLQAAADAERLDLGMPPTDGWLMPDDAASTFASAKQNALPLLIGNNAQEQGGAELPELRKAVTDAFGINAGKALAFYGLTSTEEGNNDPLYGTASRQVRADTGQRCHSVQQAIWHANAGNAVYYYQFDRPIPGDAATRHSAEVPFVFGNLLPYGFLSGPATDADRAASKQVQTYWTNFARTGDPNSSELPAWPKFDSKVRNYLEFTNNGPIAGTGLRRQICDLFMENYQQSVM
jgi:para-nitrobenzyl esterase